MTASILESIKKLLGPGMEDTNFDEDIIIHINSAFMILNQLGVGPQECFSIEGSSETWSDFMGDSKKIASVKTYIYIKVKLVFDPPTSSFVIDSLTREAALLEWRLNNQAEGGTIVATGTTV